MSILDKLKAVGLYFPKLKNVSLFKISVHIDNSTHVEGSTVTVNPAKLNGKQKRALKQIIRTEALEATGAILDESKNAEVEGVLKVLPSIQEVAHKFVGIIPPTDVPLLKACVYLRLCHERGERVVEQKTQILAVYGTRGANFANLCSAGYLETWFLPLYEELMRANPDNPTEARAKFVTLYKSIVNELPWTEFVAARTAPAKVTAHIVEKMKRNIENGVRFMNIHGLGAKNVKKIMDILPDLEAETGATACRIDKEPERIFVRLEIPHQLKG